MTVFHSHPFRRFLLIALLANLALAQPLYSLLGEQAEFLVAHGLGRGQLLIMAMVLSLAVPALLGAIPLAIAKLGSVLEREAFYLLMIVLITMVLLPVGKSLGLQGVFSIGIPVVAATALAAAYWRFDSVRLFFAYLSPAILVFPLAFLLLSRATGIVLPSAAVDSPGTVVQNVENDIVFIVLDEFPLVSLLTPDLDIDRGRFPNFAALADSAHWFPGASSGAEGTVIAVPSALTGLPPEEVRGQLPLLSNFPDNLFTRFRFSHSISAFETSTRLCPDNVCSQSPATGTHASLAQDLWLVWLHIVTPEPWSGRLPSVSNAWSGFGQQQPYEDSPGLEEALAVAEWARQMDWSQRTQTFHRFIEDTGRSDQPKVYYLHALLPHAPWNHLPDGRQYAFGETTLAPGLFQDDDGVWRWPPNDWLVTQAWQRHLLQTQYLDRLLGELLDSLAERQTLDRTLLVVMGDHGAAFVPGEPRREATPGTLTDITAVPLFIKAPGQRRGVRHDIDARLQDVLPTVLDALGLPHEGKSLLDDTTGQARGPIRIYGRVGLAAEYEFSEHMAHLHKRATEKARLFGTGQLGDIYAAGPERGLLGLMVPADIAESGTAEVDFSGRNLYLNVDPAAAFSPRLVRGEVRGLDPDSNEAIAIGVNGVIEATTRVYAGSFSALLGPEALRTGLNALEAYLIPETGRLAGLHRLRQRDARGFTLKDGSGQAIIGTAGGADIPVAAGSAGLVNIVPAEGNSLFYLAGNIGPLPQPATRVLAFFGETLAGISEVDSLTRAFSIPVSAAAVTPDVPIRVFAMLESGRQALELAFGEQCNENWAGTPPAIQQAVDCKAETETPLVRQDGEWTALLEFNSSKISGLLGSGWGNAGPGIRWSMGKSATINIPLPPGIGGLEFMAYVKPFLAPPALPEQAVWLLANDRPIDSWTLSDDRFGEIRWVVEQEVLALNPGMLELRFVTPNTRAPRALGAGDDLRELGLAFTTLSIRSSREPAQ